jgi:hypothetical protein
LVTLVNLNRPCVTGMNGENSSSAKFNESPYGVPLVSEPLRARSLLFIMAELAMAAAAVGTGMQLEAQT